jgi:sulfite dehydrogenase
MLARLDRILAPVTWVAAGLVVVMLIVGPIVVAHDGKLVSVASPYSGASSSSAKANGQQLFVGSCGSCHTLSAARTNGTVGPALDGANLSAAAVEQAMRDGPGVMPSFSGQLSDPQIRAVAAFVAGASR